jgi:hypothetical protein
VVARMRDKTTRLGRFVQSPAPAWTYRKHPTSRGRTELLCTAQRARYGRMK